MSAKVKEGIVTLSEQYVENRCADNATMRVKDIDGIKDVVNNIKETSFETGYTLRTSFQSVVSKYQGVRADVAAGWWY